MTEFAKAFLKAQMEMGTSPKFDKRAKVGSFSYEYVSLGAVLQHVVPICNKNGLSVSQEDVSKDGRQFVKTTVEHVSGEKREFFNPFCGTYSKPQEYGSAFTYTRRYALYGIFSLYGETDTDAGEFSASAPTPEQNNERKTLVGQIARLGDPVRRTHALNYYGVRDFADLDLQTLRKVHYSLSQPKEVTA